ncbi:helix-turn-helix domain-containing protein [Halorarum salinum]|uniref:Helix-turn-helix domain-containing protein n=1 Tax=Halorarum salinum TaxID=2743089 RepID=A0A7D5QGJ5_9EURY|nr:helix-turn-helix domain-containing protein [Halobaculum salinum]QLG62263.1 helix-turn-helix domain-containing protein [Halobaculum salinum]
MATVATFTVDAGEFPLGTVFESSPDVTVELERVVPTGGALVPYCWVRGAVFEDVVAAFRDHPGTVDVDVVDGVGEDVLLCCRWDPDEVGMLHGIAETGVTLVSATGTSDRWTFTVRGDDRETVARFQAYCLDHDLPVELATLQELSATDRGSNDGLTGPQREALLLAYERGYFDTPRRTTLEGLADELGISRQSFAARLRRGHRELIERAVAT